MLREEIVPYIDGNQLVAPWLANGQGGSDNGTMFTSEYIIMLKRTQGLSPSDIKYYNDRLAACLNPVGNLARRPYPDYGQDSVDNHYGVFAGCTEVGNKEIPEKIRKAMMSNWGFANNEVPGTIYGRNGKINWEAFLVRQPQLVAAMYAASGKLRFWHFPLVICAALVIATSCYKTPTTDADARRLSWLLIQTMSPVSLLCRLASKIWFRRLHRDYGPAGMRGVAAVYYPAGHPFIKYWME